MTTAAPIAAPPAHTTKVVSKRVTALDAYRGFVMFLMAAETLNFAHVAAVKPGNWLWHFLGHHQTHVEWIGCSLHDLIQPSFSFLVGVAMPFSLASRAAKGQSRKRMLLHAAWRSLVLILLGVALRTIGHSQIYWTFEDTLSQIGLGYFFLFLLGKRSARDQWIAVAVLLTGYWAAFALYPLPGADFNYVAVGVPNNWPHLMTGFAAHWNKNSNLAWAFDTWFLNLFPREKVFAFNGGGYATLSFIPTLATMILGLIAGGLLRSERAPWGKVKWFLIAGIVLLIAGWMIGWTGICPVVKRIWTPSWTLFSGGWCFVLLAIFYAAIDVIDRKRWAFPLVVIGMNSITAYCLAHVLDLPWIFKPLSRAAHAITDPTYSDYVTLLRGGMILAIFWLVLFVMYRRKIFLRI